MVVSDFRPSMRTSHLPWILSFTSEPVFSSMPICCASWGYCDRYPFSSFIMLLHLQSNLDYGPCLIVFLSIYACIIIDESRCSMAFFLYDYLKSDSFFSASHCCMCSKLHSNSPRLFSWLLKNVWIADLIAKYPCWRPEIRMVLKY